MKNYKENLKNIDTFVFDVDGVMTNGDVLLLPPNHMIRTMSTRDGLAITKAIKEGFNICIITGGNSPSVKERLGYLGVTDVFMEVKDKDTVLKDYLASKNSSYEKILYMGDDIPDYGTIKSAGVGCCPADAVQEIKAVSDYISPINGGKGCVRDVIEQTLKAQGKWYNVEG